MASAVQSRRLATVRKRPERLADGTTGYPVTCSFCGERLGHLIHGGGVFVPAHGLRMSPTSGVIQPDSDTYARPRTAEGAQAIRFGRAVEHHRLPVTVQHKPSGTRHVQFIDEPIL